MSTAAPVASFREHIIEGGVLDPEGVHHEFVSGMHGRKLDFDLIEDDDPLYREWIDVAADFIAAQFPQLPQIILGVANGTNRVALDVARRFDGAVFGAVSVKDAQTSKRLHLSDSADRLIRGLAPELVVVIEDVGTTGSNSVQVAVAALEAGAARAEVVTTWQRRTQLEKLAESQIPYRAIIDEVLTTYAAEACRAEGYCAQGWRFIPRLA